MKPPLKGLVIKYPDCIMAEVEPAIELLGTKTDLSIVGLSDLPTVAPDFLIVPGGSCDYAMVCSDLRTLIQNVNRKKGLLAGICNGALVLASAGVLKGQECTHTAVPKYAPLPQFEELLSVAAQLFDGSNYIDEDVVVSRNIITAKPWAAQRFAESVAEHLRIKS